MEEAGHEALAESDILAGKEESCSNLCLANESCRLPSADSTKSDTNAAPKPNSNLEQNNNNNAHHDEEYNSPESSGDELARVKSRISSQSSFSSIPDSVLIKRSDHEMMNDNDVRDEDAGGDGGGDGGKGNKRRKEKSYGIGLGKIRKRSSHNLVGRATSFRKTSSVKGIQIQTENEDDGESEYGAARRWHRMPSHCPPGSAALKRTTRPVNDKTGDERQSIKQYPLVLLHCHVLPPTLSLPAGLSIRDRRILEEALPPRYWRRWKLLEEKVGFGVVRDRGVLISHPQDMYDLLEERLLESLELQRPRIHGGHFIPPESEDSRDESATDDEQGYKCPDCGYKVVNTAKQDGNRKWEVRVFAANGMMKAGAWAAAWTEMEKVDVEIGLWLPCDVRMELERRVFEEQASVKTAFDAISRRSASPMSMSPSPRLGSRNHGHRCSYSTQDMPAEDQTDSLDSSAGEGVRSKSSPSLETPKGKGRQKPTERGSTHSPVKRGAAAGIALTTLLKNYLYVLAGDKRDIVILLLSIAVALLAIFSRPSPSGNDTRQPSLPEGLSLESNTAVMASSVTTTLSSFAYSARSKEPSKGTPSEADPTIAGTSDTVLRLSSLPSHSPGPPYESVVQSKSMHLVDEQIGAGESDSVSSGVENTI